MFEMSFFIKMSLKSHLSRRTGALFLSGLFLPGRQEGAAFRAPGEGLSNTTLRHEGEMLWLSRMVFTYIAFLMFLAGGLLALEKYTKWKVFNVIPPLVWLYVLNMVFCTLGLYNSDGVIRGLQRPEE